MKFKITLIDCGRNDHNSEEIKDFESFEEAGQYAYKKASSFLLSRDTSLEGEGGEYTLYAGFRPVGKVKIEEVKE